MKITRCQEGRKGKRGIKITERKRKFLVILKKAPKRCEFCGRVRGNFCKSSPYNPLKILTQRGWRTAALLAGSRKPVGTGVLDSPPSAIHKSTAALFVKRALCRTDMSVVLACGEHVGVPSATVGGRSLHKIADRHIVGGKPQTRRGEHCSSASTICKNQRTNP